MRFHEVCFQDLYEKHYNFMRSVYGKYEIISTKATMDSSSNEVIRYVNMVKHMDINIPVTVIDTVNCGDIGSIYLDIEITSMS